MTNMHLFLLALALSMDAFAVAATTGMQLQYGNGMNRRHIFRLAFYFGLFQALMPVIGWLAGRSVRLYIEQWDHWIAFGLLALVGLNMLREALSTDNADTKHRSDPTRGISLLMLAVATSVDALAVGLSIALLNISIWGPALIIGLVCCCITALGMLLGAKAVTAQLPGLRSLGHRAGILGGLVLIAIGLRILWEHGVFGTC